MTEGRFTYRFHPNVRFPYRFEAPKGEYVLSCGRGGGVERHEAVEWCAEQFGRGRTGWSASDRSIDFTDETKAMAFRLRWC